jgi:hypothetical protein
MKYKSAPPQTPIATIDKGPARTPIAAPAAYGNKHPKTLPRKAMHVRGRNRGM